MRRTDGQTSSQDDDYWFVPHSFGVGIAPATWQGWLLALGFSALLVLDIRFVHERIAQIGIGVSLSVLFAVIAIRKTRRRRGARR